MKAHRLLAFFFIITLFFGCMHVFAETGVNGESSELFAGPSEEAYSVIPEQVAKSTSPPSVSAPYALVFDRTNNTVLYAKGDLNAQIYPASTTKILTALVVAEQIPESKWDTTKISVSAKAVNLGDNSSTMGLKQNDSLTVRDALHGLLMRSGNDVAIALAEHIAGSVAKFADLMNRKAASLGMADSHFANPHGLHDPNHHTTLNDMLRAAIAFANNKALSAIAATYTYTAKVTNRNQTRSIEMNNGNGLLNPEGTYYNRYITGIKTGSTSVAQNCMVAHYEHGNCDLLILLFKNPSSCLPNVLSLVKYAEGTFSVLDLADIYGNKDFVVQIQNASRNDENNGQLALRFASSPSRVVLTSTQIAQRIRTGSSEIHIELPDDIAAPIYVGDPVGTASIYYNDEIIYSGEVIATRTVMEDTYVPSDLELIFNADHHITFWGVLKALFPWFLGLCGLALAVLLFLRIRTHNLRKQRRRRSTMYGRKPDSEHYFR